jgi:Na/Pi-cotransporter
MDLIGLMFRVFGGLAIFVYGMKLMGDGLHAVAGEKMRSILKMFSANRFVAILSGAAVTAVVQSSSAATVMVIGFVNAGLLTLVQSIGIIFGANIGTTITAQLVAFDIQGLVMPALILGMVMSFFKGRQVNGWGITILGFGFLFLGMGMMGGELKELAKDEGFRSMFRLFECVPDVRGFLSPWSVLGALSVGLLATVVIQSSSACSGIILALGASGLLNLHTAVVLVVGSNIGTTITAQLAALTANRVAKQAALAHTLFNICGALLIFVSFLFVMDGEPVFFRLVRFFSGNGELPRQIANAHTLFNGITTLALVPFVGVLANICERLISVREAKVKYRRLEPILLDTPEVALQQTTDALRKMLGKSWRSVNCAFKLYDRQDADNNELSESLDEIEREIDERQSDIAVYLSRLMEKSITHEQAGRIPMLLHCVNDAERIGDHAIIVRDFFASLHEGDKTLSDVALEEFCKVLSKLTRQAHGTLSLLAGGDDSVRRSVMTLRDEVMVATALFEQNHLTRLREKSCSTEAGIIYIELLGEMRKVSRHLANIAERCDAFKPKQQTKPGY